MGSWISENVSALSSLVVTAGAARIYSVQIQDQLNEHRIRRRSYN